MNNLSAYLWRFVTNGALPTTLVVAAIGWTLVGPIARRWGNSVTLTRWTVLSLSAVIGFTMRWDSLGTADAFWLVDTTLWRTAFVIGANWALNAILFAPAGFTLALFLRSPGKAIVVLVALSSFIETYQYFTRFGIPDPSDFVANTAGALFGALVAVLWRRRAV